MGYTETSFKNKINVGLAAWQLLNGMTIALIVTRWPRRVMYLICTISLLCVYIGWTIAMERFLNAKSQVAAKLTLFFIFAYSPVSIIYFPDCQRPQLMHLLVLQSWPQRFSLHVYGGNISIFQACSWLVNLPALRSWRRVFYHFCQSNWIGKYQMEVAPGVRVLAGIRDLHHLLLLPGDIWKNLGGTGFP